MIFLEYISNPELTSRSISRMGWYHTSDMGVMDEKGRVQIFGRKGDAIYRGTDTCYPASLRESISRASNGSQECGDRGP